MCRHWSAVSVSTAGALLCWSILPGQQDKAPNTLDANRVVVLGLKPDEANHVNTLAHQFAAIVSEYDVGTNTAEAEAEKGQTDFARSKIYSKLMPDVAALYRTARPSRDSAREHSGPRCLAVGSRQAWHVSKWSLQRRVCPRRTARSPLSRR